MPKIIAFCADGTWDSPSNDTNVQKLFRAITTTFDQVAYYDDGVGSSGDLIEKLLGGAFGAGLFQKIKDGYMKIAHSYEPGDRIFLFGFSRGAFTARSLGGMISVCGMPTQNFDDAMVETAFQAYRDKARRPELMAELNAKYAMFDAKIEMVGVWDTVGSLGIPALIGQVDPLADGFLDTNLHPDVRHAYHALSVNEERAQFPPTLWTNPAPDQVLEQVWFAGVHCDVGGGYADDANGTRLADLPLGWMMSKAAALGLAFAPGTEHLYQAPLNAAIALDTLHDSWSLLWGIPRKRDIPPAASLSNSVAFRCAADPAWHPANLRFAGPGKLAPEYTIVDVVAAADAAGA